jgi:hypothetical protein
LQISSSDGLKGGATALEEFNIGVASKNGRECFQINVTNKFVNLETNSALNLAATSAATISSPKVYVTLEYVITASSTAHRSESSSQTGNLATIHFTDYGRQD